MWAGWCVAGPGRWPSAAVAAAAAAAAGRQQVAGAGLVHRCWRTLTRSAAAPAAPAVPAAQARHVEDRVVLLSDVWLDRPDILDRLHTVFAGGWNEGWGAAPGQGPAAGGCVRPAPCSAVLPGRLSVAVGRCRHAEAQLLLHCCAHTAARPCAALPCPCRRLQPAGAAALAVCAHGQLPGGPLSVCFLSLGIVCLSPGLAARFDGFWSWPPAVRLPRLCPCGNALAYCVAPLTAAPPLTPSAAPQSFDANPGGNPGSSGNVGHYARLREHFASLGRVINQYPAIRVRLLLGYLCAACWGTLVVLVAGAAAAAAAAAEAAGLRWRTML